jgi:PIN domain-containing protein
VRFFFDNNISPKIAHALNCLVQPPHEVVHLRDRFDPATPDWLWIMKLANELDWVIISADTAISRNPHEVEAWKQTGHPIFFFKHSLLQHFSKHSGSKLRGSVMYFLTYLGLLRERDLAIRFRFL